MTIHEATDLFNAIRAELSLPAPWRLTFDAAKRRLGCCSYGPKTISLSIGYVRLNDRKVIEDVIRHEIAHALAGPYAGHGPVWRAMARRCGAVPESCVRAENVIAPKGKYQTTCCGVTYNRHKAPKPGVYRCPKCRAPIAWNLSGSVHV